MRDSVELCQRSGRARQLDSSIVLLDERPDRPLATLETARDLQDVIAGQYDPSTVSVTDNRSQRNQAIKPGEDRQSSNLWRSFQAVPCQSTGMPERIRQENKSLLDGELNTQSKWMRARVCVHPALPYDIAHYQGRRTWNPEESCQKRVSPCFARCNKEGSLYSMPASMLMKCRLDSLPGLKGSSGGQNAT
jgi:hypothetical protein